jgi:molybdate transport system permease protein
MRARARDAALGALVVVPAAIGVLFVAISLAALLVHLSPRQLGAAFASPIVRQALGLSLRTSLASTLIIAVFGTPLAAVLATPFRGRGALETLITLPVVLPPVVGGLALLLAFGRMGLLGKALSLAGISLPFTTAAVVMAQVFVSAPLYITVARSLFAQADRGLLEAAATLHASRTYTLWRVVFPPLMPALAGGLILAWARALGEFGATITFAGNLPGVTQTMPIAVYMAAQTDLGSAIAVAVALMILSYAALVAVRWVAGERAPLV